MIKQAMIGLAILVMAANFNPARGDPVSLEDRALISDQLARYAQLWDRKDAEAFVELFTDDGALLLRPLIRPNH